MINISMKAMLEAGVHFGHQTRRWNPKMARFIFGERNNIHIIDLQKTVKELKKAYTWMKDQAATGKTILMVGTKKQAQEIVKAEAERIGMPYVSEKWLGGMLTNFATIRNSVKRLDELESWEKDGVFRVLSKKEVSRYRKEMFRMRRMLTGIRTLEKLPEILFIVDPAEEEMAVAEAKKLSIPIVAVCDTNCDPDVIDHPIPGNDDAARAIKLFCAAIADAILEGKTEYDQKQAVGTIAGAEAQMVAEAEAATAEEMEAAELAKAMGVEPAAAEATEEAAVEETPAAPATPPAGDEELRAADAIKASNADLR